MVYTHNKACFLSYKKKKKKPVDTHRKGQDKESEM